MCQINFNISYTDQEGDALMAAEGRYRPDSGGAWTGFDIDLSNPRTPDIDTEGTYELQARVQDVHQAWSDWASSEFIIAKKCGSDVGVGFEISEGTCNALPKNWDLVYSHDLSINEGDVIYVDEALTTPYNGGNRDYRQRLAGELIGSSLFEVSSVGVVSNIYPCTSSGGGGLNGIPESSDGGNRCLISYRGTFKAGATDQVEMIVTNTNEAYFISVKVRDSNYGTGTHRFTGTVSYTVGPLYNTTLSHSAQIRFKNMTTGENSGPFDISAEVTDHPC